MCHCQCPGLFQSSFGLWGRRRVSVCASARRSPRRQGAERMPCVRAETRTRELRVFARTARARGGVRSPNSMRLILYNPLVKLSRELSELSPSLSRLGLSKRNTDLQTEPSLWRAVEERQRDKIDNWPHSPTPIGRCFPRGPPARVVVVTRPAPHCAQHRAARQHRVHRPPAPQSPRPVCGSRQ